MDAGMNILRFNMANDDLKTHEENYDKFEEAKKKKPEKNVAVLVDCKGPEIVTGMNRDNKVIEIQQGQSLKIVIDVTMDGDNQKINCSYKELPNSVNVGSPIFIDEGRLVCEVIEVQDVSLLLVFFITEIHIYRKLLLFCAKTLIV